ncbi:MAG: hypothetical protein OXJ90_16335, partial [Spirochaetaceae bacterium]|nr:hypothetical protein [Spirochaetaceae bacterium]
MSAAQYRRAGGDHAGARLPGEAAAQPRDAAPGSARAAEDSGRAEAGTPPASGMRSPSAAPGNARAPDQGGQPSTAATPAGSALLPAPPLLFEQSVPGRTGVQLAALDVPRSAPLPYELLRAELPLPELSEPEVVRHFTNTSRRNFSVDQGFYPLGSCTMKYNPKINDRVADLPGLAAIHP